MSRCFINAYAKEWKEKRNEERGEGTEMKVVRKEGKKRERKE